MNQIYKFQLTAGTQTRQAFPIYKDDLAIEYALEQNQLFYRGKLSGKLTFERDDYSFIVSKAFDTQFRLTISRSFDGGVTWSNYWAGQFWKTDCEFNDDDKTVIVTPSLNDRYNAVLEGLEKEYNLIDLTPEIVPIKYDKRPVVQIYVPGQSSIGCFLSNMWWEQDCEAVTNESTLHNTFKFTFNKQAKIVKVSGSMTPTLPTTLLVESLISDFSAYFNIVSNGFRFRAYLDESDPENQHNVWEISNATSGTIMWRYSYGPNSLPCTVTLYPVSGSGATGNVTLNVSRQAIYARCICDIVNPVGITTYPIPDNDPVMDNRNYSRLAGYYNPESIWIWARLSSIPLKWGLYQPGQYYVAPQDIAITGIEESFPIARNAWTDVSMWFVPSEFEAQAEQVLMKEATLKDAYPLSSVISVLLGKIAPGITHQASTTYSQFLYGTTTISNLNQRLFVTPKSNIVNSGYDQPAQKAPITLKTVLDMLRDCFRCFWFIDNNNRFRIEHISYIMNGGAYPGTPDFPKIGINLTERIVTRNGKSWAYARNRYQYDKPEIAARYQFGWMDDVTEYFDGYPIDIISNYVNKENIENIDIANFTSDIDYILLNPADVSKDGFVLLSAPLSNNEYKLPYYNYVTGEDTAHYLQNGYVSFAYLQRYYDYDMPAVDYEINGESFVATGTKRMKYQTISFPLLNEPDFTNLIKTGLGNGAIRKMIVNLSSRNANTTLEYDTE